MRIHVLPFRTPWKTVNYLDLVLKIQKSNQICVLKIEKHLNHIHKREGEAKSRIYLMGRPKTFVFSSQRLSPSSLMERTCVEKAPDMPLAQDGDTLHCRHTAFGASPSAEEVTVQLF